MCVHVCVYVRSHPSALRVFTRVNLCGPGEAGTVILILPRDAEASRGHVAAPGPELSVSELGVRCGECIGAAHSLAQPLAQPGLAAGSLVKVQTRRTS